MATAKTHVRKLYHKSPFEWPLFFICLFFLPEWNIIHLHQDLRQGEAHIEARHMNFDEAQAGKEIDSELFKNFSAGGALPLRKNHDGQTLQEQ